MSAQAANVASAKQHLSASIRHLIRATDECQPGDPLVDVLAKLSAIYMESFTEAGA